MCECDGITISLDIYSQITFCCPFLVQFDVFSFHLIDKFVYVLVIVAINEDIINIYDHNDSRAEEKTWIKLGWSEPLPD